MTSRALDSSYMLPHTLLFCMHVMTALPRQKPSMLSLSLSIHSSVVRLALRRGSRSLTQPTLGLTGSQEGRNRQSRHVICYHSSSYLAAAIVPSNCSLVSSSGFDVLWEITGADMNVSRHLSVLSSEHEHAATEYLRIYTKNTPSDAPKSFSDPPSLLKECQHRAWLYDLAALSRKEHSHR